MASYTSRVSPCGRVDGIPFDHAPSDFGARFELTCPLCDIIRKAMATPTPTSAPPVEMLPIHLSLRVPSPSLRPPPRFQGTIPRRDIAFRIAHITGQTSVRPPHEFLPSVCDTQVPYWSPTRYQRPIGLTMYQPCWQRDYKDGRARPMFGVMLASLNPSCRPENTSVPGKDVLILLQEVVP